jgi:hypothetical protein
LVAITTPGEARSCPALTARNGEAPRRIRPRQEWFDANDDQGAQRGWAVLQEAGAVRECEEHGTEIRGALDSIGDTCPECPP